MEKLNLIVWFEDLRDWGTEDVFIGMMKNKILDVIERLKTGVRVHIYQYQYDKLTGLN